MAPFAFFLCFKPTLLLLLRWAAGAAFFGALMVGAMPSGQAAYQLHNTELSDLVENYVSQQLREYRFTKSSVQVLRLPEVSLHFPQANSLTDLEVLASSPLEERFTNRVVVKVRLKGPSGLVRHFGVPVAIQAEKPVWVTTQSVRAGQPLTAQNVQLASLPVDHTQGRLLETDADLKQFEPRLYLRKGTVLDDQKVRQKLTVRSGQVVTARLRNGHGLSMSMKAKALEGGYIGQLIDIRQEGFGEKYYQAKIVSPTLVEVKF